MIALVRLRDCHVTLTNRTLADLYVGRKKCAVDEAIEWPVGQSLQLENNVQAVLESANDTKPKSKPSKPSGSATSDSGSSVLNHSARFTWNARNLVALAVIVFAMYAIATQVSALNSERKGMAELRERSLLFAYDTRFLAQHPQMAILLEMYQDALLAQDKGIASTEDFRQVLDKCSYPSENTSPEIRDILDLVRQYCLEQLPKTAENQ
ncbi:MAG: hypothetical protein R3C28_28500 [Pirellulaceae bacterium]